MSMAEAEWHKRYKQALIDYGGGNIDEEFAEQCLQAGMGEYDYTDVPEESALMEMSYWEE